MLSREFKTLFILLFSLFFTGFARGQGAFESFSGDEANAPELFTERIVKISPNKKIFIISNDNNGYNKGDFISILYDENLAARALVAKTTSTARGGIKILKIYSLDLWNQLKQGTEIQVLRGDDSFYRKKDEEKTEEEALIEDEDDLFDETTLLEGDNIEVDENRNRVLKNDNLISFYVSRIEGIDTSGSSQRYTQFGGLYAYQVADNVFLEAGYGQNIVSDFPSDGLDTKLTNITIRAKYTFAAPYFSFLQPYLGYQVIGAESDGAGVAGDNTTDDQLEQEVILVENLQQNRIVFGVTALRRLVPGWFARLDLGSDLFAIGVSLEF